MKALPLLITSCAFTFFLSSDPAWAGQQAQTHIKTPDESPKQVDAYNILSREAITQNNLTKGRDFARKAMDLANKINYRQGKAEAFMNLGQIEKLQREFKNALTYMLQGIKILEELPNNQQDRYNAYTDIAFLYQDWDVYDKALEYERKALQMAEQMKDSNKRVNILWLMGFAYQKTNQENKAIEAFEACRDFYKRSGDRAQYASMMGRLASIYTKRREFEKALSVNQEVLSIKLSMGDMSGASTYLNDIGFIYNHLGDTKSALRYFKEALNLNRKLGKDDEGNATLLINIGVLAQKSGDLTQAQNSYEEVLEIRKRQRNDVDIAQAYIHLATVYEGRRQFYEAQRYAQLAVDHARRSQDYAIIERSYQRLLLVQERSGNYRKALGTMRSFLTLKDSTLKVEQQKNAQWLESRLDVEAQERRLEMLDLQNQKRQAEVSNLQMEAEKQAQQLDLLQREKALQASRLRQEELERERQQQALLLAQQQLNNEKKSQEINELQKDKKLNELLITSKEAEERDRRREIEILERERELKDIRLRDEETLKKYYIGMMGLVGAVVVLLGAGYVQNRRKNQRLAIKNMEILEQKQEIEQQRDLISTAKVQIEKAYDNIQMLSEFGQKITSTLDFDSINWTSYAYVNSLMDATIFGISLYDEEQDMLTYLNLLENGEQAPQFSVRISQPCSLEALCLKSQEEIIINDYQSHIHDYMAEEATLYTKRRPGSLIYLPLSAERQLGVISVQSYEANSYNKNDINILRMMASYISIALTNANAYETINSKNKHITDSIRYAQTIQRAILPTLSRFKRAMLESFIMFRPKDIVSGDYYWYSRITSEEIERSQVPDKGVHSLVFVAAVDCTGHGVPGGFMSMIGNTLLNEIVNQKHVYDPAQILTLLNEGIVNALDQQNKANDDGMDVSLCVIHQRHKGGDKVIFAGAKRPLFYLQKGNSELQEIKGDNKAIGGVHSRKSAQSEFSSKTLELEKGSVLYLVTDGLADQHNADGKKFGKLRMIELLEQNASKPMFEQKAAIEAALDEHQGKMPQRDDITLIGVRL